MSTEIIIAQDMWEEDSEGVITTWFASDGGQVQQGSLIAEVMVEKVQHEILAPASGTLTISRQVDDVIVKGDVIGVIA